MRALSIVRPGGSKIATGQKTLEVRRWRPLLAPDEDLLIVENGRFLREDGDEDRDGIAVAIVNVVGVRPFTLADMARACAARFEEGWLAWELAAMRPLERRTKVLAARGIYEVDFSRHQQAPR